MSKATTAKNATTSKKLGREKVLEAIFDAPSAMRPKLKKLLNAQIKDRQGSEDWVKEHPAAKPISNAHKIEMANLHDQYKVSFRALESIYHLIANSGMGAYRCVLEGRSLQKQKGRKTSINAKRQTAAVA